MRLPDILLFTLLLSVAFPVANALQDVYGVPIFTVQQQAPANWGINDIQTGSQCTVSANGTAICDPTLSTQSTSLLSTILFWGDMFGSMLRFIAACIVGVVLPAYMAVHNFGVNPVLAVLINAGVWFEYFLFYTYFISGRFTGHG
jgi:hypothetical protein